MARSRVTASRRWRRTKRASASAMSNVPSTAIVSSSVPRRGPGGRRHRAREGQGGGHGVARAALGIDGQGGLAERRSGTHHEDEEHEEARRRGWRARRAAPARWGAAAGRSRARARPRPRPRRRTTHAGRSAATRAGDGGRRGPARISVSAGSSTTPSEAGSAGMNGGAGCAAGPACRPGPADPRHHASLPAGRRRGRGTRRRQRRVGDTSWTDRTMRMSAAMTIAATLRGQ